MTLLVCGLPFERALSEALGARPELGAERAPLDLESASEFE